MLKSDKPGEAWAEYKESTSTPVVRIDDLENKDWLRAT